MRISREIEWFGSVTIALAVATAIVPTALIAGDAPIWLVALVAAGLLALQIDPLRRAARAIADCAALVAIAEAHAPRAAQRHGVTGLPTREPLLDAIAADPTEAMLLGTIRFADHDRLAAFDRAAADTALAQVADRLMRALARGRILAQVDRDVFAIWFAGLDATAAAAELAALGYVLRQEMHVDAIRLVPDIELGAATADGADPATLLTRALVALARPDASGAPRIVRAAPAAARERFSLEQDLRRAVANEELTLHYQPVVDVARGCMVAAEALVRWQHPVLGAIPPARFVPILEESGLADEIGLWILDAACREAAGWQAAGHTVKVAVNLSARQLRDPALDTLIIRTIDRHGLAPQRLELELTETAALGDADRTRALFQRLRAIGVTVAIDDFGSGYSSLSYVKNLPFDKLKIDREFVTDVDTCADSRAICRTLIELGRGLGIAVLAEGVETAAEVATLRALGCTLFQGFHFSRPLDAAAFNAALTAPISYQERLSA